MARLNLPDMQKDVPLVEDNKTPSYAFHRWWMSVTSNLQTTFDNLQGAVTSIQAALDAADIAVAAASDATAAAATATTAAAGSTAISSLSSSGVTGLTLSATDAGADATVTISAHTRVYGDGTSVAVSGGTVTALAYSTFYYIYYLQPSRAGGSVTYQATASEITATQTGDTHLVGSITTPAAGAPATPGKTVRPPGVGNIEP